MGFTRYYRYFIYTYSAIARPLLELTRKATTWHWNAEQQQAFETLRNRMCEQPVLRQPDFNKTFFVHVDASAYGVGAVLCQEGSEINNKKPKQHPLAYYSATFTPTERNYDVYERELLAVIKALNHWKAYLKWTTKPFTIYMDHANLLYLSRSPPRQPSFSTLAAGIGASLSSTDNASITTPPNKPTQDTHSAPQAWDTVNNAITHTIPIVEQWQTFLTAPNNPVDRDPPSPLEGTVPKRSRAYPLQFAPHPPEAYAISGDERPDSPTLPHQSTEPVETGPEPGTSHQATEDPHGPPHLMDNT